MKRARNRSFGAFEPSAALRRWSQTITDGCNGPILDLACGGGRNSLLLASLGSTVVGVDINFEKLRLLRSQAEAGANDAKAAGKLLLLCSELADSAWPFRDSIFAAVIVVHFLAPALIERINKVLKPSGYLILETIGGHGENYRQLPGRGVLSAQLKTGFDVIEYEERGVGPPDADAVAVKLLARKRASGSG